jgi:hypothetical protein
VSQSKSHELLGRENLALRKPCFKGMLFLKYGFS